MTRLQTVSSGTSLVVAGPVCVMSVSGSCTQGGASAATLALHNVAVTGDVGAANLIHTFSLPRATGETGNFQFTFSGALFPDGLCAVLTLNSNTADVVIEYN